ncbi:hypothetical protein ILUMI_08526 [Ignelater luminosus]|uniref:DUF3456 domain-containing protein n=1 Tax=Ignelater luminosus TaxID=2038154 RepID=A0A8K0GFC3_IGNLU|nr:hypothetical protein ILUMI_08526 [Ignelater luminosus]
MYKIIICFLFSIIFGIQAKTHIDVKELRCLVCKATLEELDIAIKKIDPSRKVEIGGYRLDPEGNLKQRSISEAKSEIHLSELADSICEKMEDYIRATWKHNGKLTILRLIDSNGQMNVDMGRVDVIQDDDLNKSLKYYCEGIIEEYEESIIKYYKNDSKNIEVKVCTEEAQLCPFMFPEPKEPKQHETDEL